MTAMVHWLFLICCFSTGLLLNGCGSSAPSLEITMLQVTDGQLPRANALANTLGASAMTSSSPVVIKSSIKNLNCGYIKGLKIRLHGQALKDGIVSTGTSTVLLESHGPDKKWTINAPAFTRTGDDSCEATIDDFDGAPMAATANIELTSVKSGNRSLSVDIVPLNATTNQTTRSMNIAVTGGSEQKKIASSFSQRVLLKFQRWDGDGNTYLDRNEVELAANDKLASAEDRDVASILRDNFKVFNMLSRTAPMTTRERSAQDGITMYGVEQVRSIGEAAQLTSLNDPQRVQQEQFLHLNNIKRAEFLRLVNDIHRDNMIP